VYHQETEAKELGRLFLVNGVSGLSLKEWSRKLADLLNLHDKNLSKVKKWIIKYSPHTWTSITDGKISPVQLYMSYSIEQIKFILVLKPFLGPKGLSQPIQQEFNPIILKYFESKISKYHSSIIRKEGVAAMLKAYRMVP
jgi:hypothetical protein